MKYKNMNIKSKFKASALCISIAFLSACSSEPDLFEAHLGYWLSVTDFGAIEVTGHDGDYQFRFIQTDRLSESSKELDLTVSDGRLFWNPKGMGPRELILIDGELRLRFEGNVWSRSNEDEINKIRAANKVS